MIQKKEHPALAARGVPEISLAASKSVPENISPIVAMQAARLVQRCAISTTLALALAPFVFPEGPRGS